VAHYRLGYSPKREKDSLQKLLLDKVIVTNSALIARGGCRVRTGTVNGTDQKGKREVPSLELALSAA